MPPHFSNASSPQTIAVLKILNPTVVLCFLAVMGRNRLRRRTRIIEYQSAIATTRQEFLAGKPRERSASAPRAFRFAYGLHSQRHSRLFSNQGQIGTRFFSALPRGGLYDLSLAANHIEVPLRNRGHDAKLVLVVLVCPEIDVVSVLSEDLFDFHGRSAKGL
jgi:hypothetical protein